MGTFGPVTVRVPRARLDISDGKTAEWKNTTIPAYQRRTKQADALIAGAKQSIDAAQNSLRLSQYHRLRRPSLTIIDRFRENLCWRSFAHHYHGNEAHSRGKHHVPGRCQRIARRVNQPGDDQLGGAAEGGDGDGINCSEGAPRMFLGRPSARAT